MTAMRLTLLPLLGLLMGAAPAPASPAAPKMAVPQRQALTGNWAGDAFALRVTPDGYVVQGQCASGKITSPVFPDAAGSFVANGYFNRQRSGYRLSDIAPRDTPARFTGTVKGNSLTLTMAIAGKPGEERFVLKRDAKISFPKCD
jgi:hypothetical protein